MNIPRSKSTKGNTKVKHSMVIYARSIIDSGERDVHKHMNIPRSKNTKGERDQA